MSSRRAPSPSWTAQGQNCRICIFLQRCWGGRGRRPRAVGMVTYTHSTPLTSSSRSPTHPPNPPTHSLKKSSKIHLKIALLARIPKKRKLREGNGGTWKWLRKFKGMAKWEWIRRDNPTHNSLNPTNQIKPKIQSPKKWIRIYLLRRVFKTKESLLNTRNLREARKIGNRARRGWDWRYRGGSSPEYNLSKWKKLRREELRIPPSATPSNTDKPVLRTILRITWVKMSYSWIRSNWVTSPTLTPSPSPKSTSRQTGPKRTRNQRIWRSSGRGRRENSPAFSPLNLNSAETIHWIICR